MKVVYLYDGTPHLVFKNEEGEYQYPEETWTEMPPPEGIYSPFYFDGNEWIGATREEWLESFPKDEDGEPQSPDQSILQMAQTQMQVAESSYQLRETQQKLALTMLDNAEKDKSIKNLEQQQAQILLEIAEMKGGK
ncbi:hypothetical protein [Staphylococcus sp. HMSC056G08]|uniref:hypothetical protein n=1 Tax=Staphylococcus sp. HMSC056G08 TaxID=1739350 RepID=UPI0008A15C9D|nr:hypothetical protein [Staphylococcus sp. HMSC056G08]OFJ79467.1 hypothetical protein HMPREF2846_06845 [Staphylococcus sp. HMSC056G08]